MLRRHILPWLVLGFYRLLSSTWRTVVVESDGHRALRDQGRARVFAHWHRDEFAILRYAGLYRIAAMTSQSKDGQLIDFVIRKLGGATAKGSSSRGGATALHGMMRLMKEGWSASFAVDGPRGPIYKAKAGVFQLSRISGAPIIPVGIASQHRFIFSKSWNKARLPYPFSRIVLVLGDPLVLDFVREPDLKCPLLAARLETRIAAACSTAETHGRSLVPRAKAREDGFA